jgi:hypothetical protein
MELNNISTAEEENIKAGQKYRSEHPQSLGVDATKRASSFRRYWRQSGKK